MKKRKSKGGGGRRDHVVMINELPDALLCSILSLLPTKQAVAASSVCRRWRYLWKFLTNLDLDIATTSTSALSDVTNVVFSQQSSFIQSCRIVTKNLHFEFLTHDPEEPRIWIEFLSDEKRLEKLVLVFYNRLYWSNRLLDCTNLRVLELVSAREQTSGLLSDDSYACSYFAGCVNLESLKLDSLILNLQALLGIIDNCRSLKNLALFNLGLTNEKFYSLCTNVSLEIKSQRIKHLEVDNCNLESFSLHCQNLNYLEIKNLVYLESLKVDCESLKALCMANVEYNSLCGIRCPNLDDFRIDSVSSKLCDRLTCSVGCEGHCLDF